MEQEVEAVECVNDCQLLLQGFQLVLQADSNLGLCVLAFGGVTGYLRCVVSGYLLCGVSGFSAGLVRDVPGYLLCGVSGGLNETMER